MKMKFTPALQLDLLHDYFKDKAIPALQMQPTPETARLLSALNWLYRNTDTGMVCLAQVPTDASTSSNAPTDKEKVSSPPSERFSFAWTVNDHLFRNYTAQSLPFGQVFYSQFRVEENESGSELLPLYPLTFQLPLDQDLQELEKYTVADSLGEVVFSHDFLRPFNKTHLPVDLRGLGAGAYTIALYPKPLHPKHPVPPTEVKVYASDGFSNLPPIGVVEIERAGLAPAEDPFQLEFRPRKTYWRYFVYRSNGKTPGRANIKADGLPSGNGDFMAGTSVRELPNGKKAHVFTSPGEIQYSETPTGKVKLTLPDNDISMELPYGSPSSLRAAASEGPVTYYSDMYVNY